MVDRIDGVKFGTNGVPASSTETSYAAKKASIFGENSTKEFSRQVGNDTREILVGKDKNGNKIRVDAETLEELVTVDSSGKNKYITKTEFNKLIEQVLGVKQLPEGMTAEFKHGNLVFKRGGDVLSAKELREDAGLIAQRESEEILKTARLDEMKKSLAQSFAPKPDLTKMPDVPTIQVATPKPQGATSKKAAETPKTIHKQLDEVVVVKKRVVDSQPEIIKAKYPNDPAKSAEEQGLHELNGSYYKPGAKTPKPQGDAPAARQKDAFYEWNPAAGAFVKKGASKDSVNKAIAEREKEIAAQQAKKKATEAAQAKRKEIKDKGLLAGRLVGITPDRILDQIMSDMKSLNAGNVRTYLDGYKTATAGRQRNNIVHQLWKTDHYGKTENVLRREKLDAISHILQALSQTPGAKNVTFVKTTYKAGKPQQVKISLESVIKTLQNAKANLQKGIPADEAVRDAERILSRFGYGNPDA